MAVGKNAQQAREQVGMSLSEVAEITGIAEDRLKDFEAGAIDIKWSELEKIATAYSIDWIYLLEPPRKLSKVRWN